ncbi:MAG: hypothetical protein AAGU02_09200, partial [Lawsonibacter sp.]
MTRLTPVTRRYLYDFLFRLTVFLSIAVPYVIHPASLDFTAPGSRSVFLLLLWLSVLSSMVVQLNPKSGLTTGCRKQYSAGFASVPDYPPDQLGQAVRLQNRGAAKVAALWLAVNLSFGVLYHLGMLGVPDLVFLCALAFLCDL